MKNSSARCRVCSPGVRTFHQLIVLRRHGGSLSSHLECLLCARGPFVFAKVWARCARSTSFWNGSQNILILARLDVSNKSSNSSQRLVPDQPRDSNCPARTRYSQTLKCMLGLDDYGSSSEEEGAEEVRVVAPSSTTQPTITTPACGADARHTAEPGGGVGSDRGSSGVSTSSVRPTGLPSASTLLETSAKGVGSAGMQPRGPTGGVQAVGTKRPASGSFPISDVAHKSGRGGQHKHVSARPVNTLLPPQLRGRSNNTTQDLEGMGLKSKKPSAPR